MSLRKLSLCALFVAILVFAAVERLNRHVEEFDAASMDTQANRPSLGAESHANSELLSADFLPVQSRSAKNLTMGKLLVAGRNLGDPSFAKSVILLVRYDPKGVLGLMLNHRTDVPLSRALETLKAAKDRSDPVYLGGPVELPSVFALLRSPTKLEGAENVFDGVYLISDKTLFEQTIAAKPDPHVFHVYLGYAGWTQAQLQQEVDLGAWFVFPADANKVFNDDPDSLWQEMIRKTELQMARSESTNRNPLTEAEQVPNWARSGVGRRFEESRIGACFSRYSAQFLMLK